MPVSLKYLFYSNYFVPSPPTETSVMFTYTLLCVLGQGIGVERNTGGGDRFNVTSYIMNQ